MSRYIIGTFKKLKRGEQVIIAMGFVGIISVISFAVIQLLLRILV
jgi:preprotein translocase subunit YajC